MNHAIVSLYCNICFYISRGSTNISILQLPGPVFKNESRYQANKLIIIIVHTF